MRRSLLLAALTFATPALADGESRTLVVVNDTSAAVNQLFVTAERPGGIKAKVSGIFATPADERDRLANRMLPRGGTITVELKGERCRYDVRAVLEDGRTYAADDFDVCARGRWAIGSGVRR